MGLLYRKTGRAAAAQKVEKDISIANRLGLHARPAAMFVRIASRHRSEIWVSKEGERSEEHTSELQSRQYLVCRLLLEKKKRKERTKQRQQMRQQTHSMIEHYQYARIEPV